jgi:hypothetical protein
MFKPLWYYFWFQLLCFLHLVKFCSKQNIINKMFLFICVCQSLSFGFKFWLQFNSHTSVLVIII